MPHTSYFQKCLREGKGASISYAILMQIGSSHRLGRRERASYMAMHSSEVDGEKGPGEVEEAYHKDAQPICLRTSVCFAA